MRLGLAVILALVMGFGAQVDMVLVAMIAKEQRLAAVGDEDKGLVGKRHRSSNYWSVSQRAFPLPRSLLLAP